MYLYFDLFLLQHGLELCDLGTELRLQLVDLGLVLRVELSPQRHLRLATRRLQPLARLAQRRLLSGETRSDRDENTHTSYNTVS